MDAVFISPDHGIVAIDLIEGNDSEGYEDRQEDLVRLLGSRLMLQRTLVKKGKLRITPEALSFSAIDTVQPIDSNEDGYPLCGPATLDKTLEDLRVSPIDIDTLDSLTSAVQNLSGLRSGRTPRVLKQKDSRGAKLSNLEKSIATLDKQQSEAVVATIDGVQRIRGLAGSGKTIVLALKAAYLHAYHPEWNIAVTFNARSLQDQFVRLIRRFFIEQGGEEPDWNRLRVMNAWGGRGREGTGIYAEFCRSNNIDFWDFRGASQMYGSQGAFEGVCSAALKEVADPVPFFDAILVDEAQDFPPSFLRLCYEMLDEQKRLVYAYDELQNLSGKGMASTEEIFGVGRNGRPRVDFESNGEANHGSQRDIVLEKCYRNSGPLLVTAHALGFGIYREPPEAADTGIVQMFDKADLWHDIGYESSLGPLQAGQRAELIRTNRTSPHFLENHSNRSDLIQFHTFANEEEQNSWVADQITANLGEDDLRHDDIMVVNPNPLTARTNLGPLRKALLRENIQSHLAGVDTSADVFFQRDQDSVTFTGIYRAKGNEAGMVYVVNAQEGQGQSANLALVRNRLFTAITRSKAWVRVVGVGPEMEQLKTEFERVREAEFALDFIYPDEVQRAKMRILHREVNADTQKAINSRNTSARLLLEDLQSKRLFLEDLDPEITAQLRSMLSEQDD